MQVIHANCRVQFTAGDMDFITAVLGRKKQSAGFLVSLLSDVETRDLILDDEMLFRALLEQRGCLRVSPHLYFYVLVRHVLRESGMEDRSVADYVAELLTEFSREERTRCVLRGQLQPMDYFFEMLTALQTADDYTAFCLRAHIGNHSLFFLGCFSRSHSGAGRAARLPRFAVLPGDGAGQLSGGQPPSPGQRV